MPSTWYVLSPGQNMERRRADVRGDSGVEQVVRMVRLWGGVWAGGGGEEEEVQEGEGR